MAKSKKHIPPTTLPVHTGLAAQRAWERMQEEVEAQKAATSAMEAKFEHLDVLWRKLMNPRLDLLAEARYETAVMLEYCALGHKLRRDTQQALGQCIVQLCREAFARITPSPEQVALHDRWSSTAHAAKEAAQAAAERSFMDEFLRQQGISIEGEDEAAQAHRQYAYRQYSKQASQELPPPKGKSAGKHKQEAQTDARSLRGIYIAVAKCIHPDTEPDPIRRLHKEEEMKRLIAAYEAGDLSTLLQMEAKWGAESQGERTTLAPAQEEQLLALLKGQLDKARRAHQALLLSPRYTHLIQYAPRKEETAQREIKRRAKDIDSLVKEFGKIQGQLTGPYSKAALENFIFNYRYNGEDF